MPRSRTNKHLVAARRALIALVLLVVGIAGWQWLQSHPQHSPWAPLDLRDPPGWATRTKLIALRSDVAECRAVLERSEIAFTALPETGEGDCARPDRTRLGDYPLAPDTPAVTCPVAAALELWRRESVAPAASNILGSDLARIEHLGAFSCRRMYGGADGPWSEHATANAIEAGDDEEAMAQSLSERLQGRWSIATALAFLAWFVFAPQCLATLAAVKRETGGWKMPLVMAGYRLALAYAASFVT